MEENKKDFSMSGYEDGCARTVLFTAGTALAAVCLKRAAVAVFLLRQWRLWVFLVMNVLLLAILFTSALSSRSRPSRGRRCGSVISVRKEGRKKMMKKRKNVVGFSASASPLRHICEAEEARKDPGVTKDAPRPKPEEECELSDEELNERVESFIASFRQQLVSDARELEGGFFRT